MTMYLGDQEVAPIVPIEVPEKKYGVDINAVFGDVDANGVLQSPSGTGTVDLSSVKHIDNSFALAHKFYRNQSLSGNVIIGLVDVNASDAMYGCFQGCTGLTSVDLSSLTTVSGTNAMNSCFQGWTSLPTISFPALKEILPDSSQNQFSNMFYGCTALTEIHFPSNMQERIEKMSGYSTQFGATNATIYFDLPSTAE